MSPEVHVDIDIQISHYPLIKMRRIYLLKFFQISILTFFVSCVILLRGKDVIDQFMDNDPQKSGNSKIILDRIESPPVHIGRSLDGINLQKDSGIYYESDIYQDSNPPARKSPVIMQSLLQTEKPASDEVAELTELRDLFISVKTTKRFHRGRVGILLDTWAKLARDQTYFFSDAADEELSRRTKGRLIHTNCSQGHNRQELCCKMAAEFDQFLLTDKKWFCHVDDDTYVNTRRLVRVLRQYRHTRDWYLGKPSLGKPIQLEDRDRPGEQLSFWFATGGAGFCISRSLSQKMAPHAARGGLREVCEKIRLPDDCSVGYVINHLLKTQLTVLNDFHSHLEGLRLLNPRHLHKHITLSYAPIGGRMNVVKIEGFSIQEDPTRLYSVHCKLYPYLEQCRHNKQLR